MLKKLLAATTAALLGVGIAVVGVSPVFADRPDELLCTDITDDTYEPKVDADADDPFYVAIPDGFTLVAYCVKAGTEPVIVTLDEPIVGPANALIDHPDKDSVSHYQLKLIPTEGPEEVSGAVTPEDQFCDDNYELAGGYITPTATTGVVYELYADDGSDAPGALIDGTFDAKSGALAPGTYWVKVLPASEDYTVAEEDTWIKVTINAYVGDCEPPDEPEEVSGAAVAEAQICTENFELEGGYITPTPTTGVVYELYADDGSDAPGALIDGTFDAKSGELAPGTYWVKVLPASEDYTVSEANTWIKVVVDPYDGLCVPTLPTVEVVFTSTQPTCEVLQGSFRFGLAPDQGFSEDVVEWTVDTGNGPEAGTPGVVYPAAAGTTVTVVATATKGYGLSGDEDGVITFGPVTFTAADDCLDTLPLTGANPAGLVGFAAAMVVLGGLALAAARRSVILERG